MSDRDQEQLAALETERAYLVQNGKERRVGDVDEQITAVKARIKAARGADEPETATGQAPEETADSSTSDDSEGPKARRRPPTKKT